VAAWVEFDIDAKLTPGEYYYIRLPATRGLHWSLVVPKPAHTSRAWRSGEGWNPSPECYAFRLEPGIDGDLIVDHEGEPFAPEYVVNGFARAIRGWPNAWRPDPEAEMPQWIELDFDQPVPFDEVHVSFQSAEMRAGAFTLEVPDGSGWKTIARIDDNRARRVVVPLEPTKAAKIRVTITDAMPEMGVCEIRVYDTPDDR
jgi:hypothetical protein